MTSSLSAGTIVLFVGLAFFAACIMYGMLFVFAQLIGWSSLVRRFGYTSGYVGSFAASKGVLLGRHGWNAPPLHIGMDEDGIVLRPLAPLRNAFNVVRVPWIAIVSLERRTFMFFETTTLRYGPEPDAEISFVSGGLADEIAARRPGAAAGVAYEKSR